jgi:lipopolysaccharide biosynthesis glycosyltransferase
MRTVVVTAANEAYFPLLGDLIRSLHQWETSPVTDIACFDVGLAPNSQASIARHVSRIVEPGWDLPVDGELRAKQPWLRAQTARPFLPRYFPGYDVYLWIDADAWVQERFALDRYIESAAEGSLGAVPHVHVAYRTTPATLHWRRSRMQAYFGQKAAEEGRWDTYLNSGVIALPPNAPHWALWAKSFCRGLEATNGKGCCDQTALNYAVWKEHLPVEPLPALCNWLCHLALPSFDSARRRFYEPVAPGHPIGILHLTGNPKVEPRADGSTRTISLRFPDSSPPLADRC